MSYITEKQSGLKIIGELLNEVPKRIHSSLQAILHLISVQHS